MQIHLFANVPRQCVATDLLGPNRLFFTMSRGSVFKTVSSKKIIKAIEKIFCRLGYPNSLRTDYNSQNVSSEFENLYKMNSIIHIKTPRLKIASANKWRIEQAKQKFILMHNVTPHGTTGTPPSELLFNRVIRDKTQSIQDIT